MKPLLTILAAILFLHVAPAARGETLADAVTACRAAARAGNAEAAAAAATRAETMVRSSIAANGDAPSLRYELASIALECRMPFAEFMERGALAASAEGDLRAALTLEETHVPSRLLLGILLSHLPPFLNRTEDAVRELEQAISQIEAAGASAPAEAREQLAAMYERLGRAADAARIRATLREPSKEDASNGGAPTGSPDPLSTARLRAIVEAELAKQGQAGLAVAVIAAGEPLLLEGFGLADLENEVPMTPESVVRIGSITKTFVAATALRLHETKRIDLDAPISRWIGDAGASAGGITLSALLSHTAGLPRDLPSTPDGTDAWIGSLLSDPARRPAGQAWQYSNAGYVLAGAALEAATGESLETLVTREVLDRAGLQGTRFCDEKAIVLRRAQGYEWFGSRLRNDDPDFQQTHLLAAGGMCSNARDLAHFVSALRDGDILSPESFARMTASTRLSGGSHPYGLGLNVRELGDRPAFHHSGATHGFLSAIAYDPSEELIVVVVTNSEASDPAGLRLRLLEASRERS